MTNDQNFLLNIQVDAPTISLMQHPENPTGKLLLSLAEMLPIYS